MELLCLNNDTNILRSIIENMNNELINPQKLQELIDWIQNPTITKNLKNVMKKCAECLGLYYCSIYFDQGKFQMKVEHMFVGTNQNKNCVFLVLNGVGTMCGLLYSLAANGEKQMVFSWDDQCAKSDAEKYIDQLNHTGA